MHNLANVNSTSSVFLSSHQDVMKFFPNASAKKKNNFHLLLLTSPFSINHYDRKPVLLASSLDQTSDREFCMHLKKSEKDRIPKAVVYLLLLLLR